jgi:hypothetical protein
LVKENKKYQCIPSFPLKTIRRHLINNKLKFSNFQLVLLFRFKMHAFVFYVMDRRSLRENNGPLKVLLSQSQSAISLEVMLAI